MSDRGTQTEPLWDATFRARLLRQGLSSDEIAQVVELAEGLDARLSRVRALLELIVSHQGHDRIDHCYDEMIQTAKSALTVIDR